MTAPTPTVTAFFDVSGSSTVFILDDPVRGLLDNVTYVLAGNIATDITQYIRSVRIRRGRERALDEFTTGVATLTANNQTRIFDPSYAAGTYYGNIVPGKRVTIAAGGITVFDGLIDDWDFSYPISKDSTVSFDVADCLAQLGSAEFDAWTATAGQAVGARLSSILDRTEVAFPGGLRTLDTGTSTLQADAVALNTNVLNYAQTCVRADLGQLFASKDGVLIFYGRNRVVTGVGAPLFADDGTGINYTGVEVDYGTELLFNRVSVTATGFAVQTVTDTTSYNTFGKWYSLSISGLPLADATQAAALANYLLNLYKSPTSRFKTVTVALHSLTTAQQTSVLNLDIGSVVQVIYTPNKVSTSINKYCLVEGIDHVIGPSYHSMTLKLSNLIDGFSGRPFILDDTTYGVLDTLGAGVLAF